MADEGTSSGSGGSEAQAEWVKLLILLVSALGGFWILLGHRFSPETYLSAPIVRGTTEMAWFAGALVLALFVGAGFRRDPRLCERLARALLPVAMISVIVFVCNGLFGTMPYVAVLGFGLACGIIPVMWCGQQSRESQSQGALWDWLLIFITVSLGVYYYRQQVWYWNNLALGYADIVEMARVMFNSVNHPADLFLQVNPDKPMFFDHFQPGILPFLPLWAIWPDVRLLVVFQVVAVVGVAWPLYSIGKQLFRDKASAFLLAMGWLAHPSCSQFIYGGSYGFKWGSFCLPLYFIALACWLRGRWGWAFAVAYWAMLIKEEAGILIGMFGLYLFLFRRQRTGLAVSAVGFGYFLLLSAFVMPRLLGEGGYLVQGYFQGLGNSKLEILLSPLQKPEVFWGRLFSRSTFDFAATLLAPLLFLPIRKPSALFLGSLTFLFVSLWDNPQEKSICYQYQSALLVACFYALARGLEGGQTELATRRRAWLTGVVVAGGTISIFLGMMFWSKDSIAIQVWPGRLALVEEMKANINRDSSLLATQRAAAHFVDQRFLYVGEPAPLHFWDRLPPGLDFVLLDFRDRWRTLGGLGWIPDMRRYQRLMESTRPDLKLVAVEDGMLLYGNRGTPLDPRERVERLLVPSGAMTVKIELNEGVKIVGFFDDRISTSHGDQVLIQIVCLINAPTRADLAVRCILDYCREGFIEESFASEWQPLGQGIWPVDRWEVGKFYVDEFLIFAPPLLHGQRPTLRFESQLLAPLKTGDDNPAAPPPAPAPQS